jgi:hypothetical protein
MHGLQNIKIVCYETVWVISAPTFVNVLRRVKKGPWSFGLYTDGLFLCVENLCNVHLNLAHSETPINIYYCNLLLLNVLFVVFIPLYRVWEYLFIFCTIFYCVL